MKKLLKKQITLHIILTSITLLSTSNMLAIEPIQFKKTTDPRSIHVNFDGKKYTINANNAYTLETVSNDINKIQDLKAKFCIAFFTVLGLACGSAFGHTHNKNNENACAILGTTIGLSAGYQIVVKEDVVNNNYKQEMHNYLREKQIEHFLSS